MSIRKLAIYLDIGSKATSVFAVLVIFLGYLTTNLWLSSYGMWDPGLFSPSLIPSGLWSFSITALCVMSIYYMPKKTRIQKLAVFSCCVGTIFLVLLIIPKVIYPQIPKYFGGGKPVVVAINLKNPQIIPDFKEYEEDEYIVVDLIYWTNDFIVIDYRLGSFQISISELDAIHYMFYL